MTCQSCCHQFCWLCFAPWHSHGSRQNEYKCNNFYTVEGNINEAEKRTSKIHMKLLKYIRQKMKMCLDDGMPWVNVQFLQQSMDILTKCRQTLKLPYTFAFYLARNKNLTAI